MATILFFGRLSDTVQISAEIRALPETVTSTTHLRTWLDTAHNTGGALLEKTIRIAINNEIAHEPAAIKDADEIAFMPPVGGG